MMIPRRTYSGGYGATSSALSGLSQTIQNIEGNRLEAERSKQAHERALQDIALKRAVIGSERRTKEMGLAESAKAREFQREVGTAQMAASEIRGEADTRRGEREKFTLGEAQKEAARRDEVIYGIDVLQTGLETPEDRDAAIDDFLLDIAPEQQPWVKKYLHGQRPRGESLAIWDRIGKDIRRIDPGANNLALGRQIKAYYKADMDVLNSGGYSPEKQQALIDNIKEEGYADVQAVEMSVPVIENQMNKETGDIEKVRVEKRGYRYRIVPKGQSAAPEEDIDIDLKRQAQKEFKKEIYKDYPEWYNNTPDALRIDAMEKAYNRIFIENEPPDRVINELIGSAKPRVEIPKLGVQGRSSIASGSYAKPSFTPLARPVTEEEYKKTVAGRLESGIRGAGSLAKRGAIGIGRSVKGAGKELISQEPGTSFTIPNYIKVRSAEEYDAVPVGTYIINESTGEYLYKTNDGSIVSVTQ